MVKPDVIAAISTAFGRAGIGIVRLSGPDLQRFVHPLLGRAIPARYATFTDFRDSSGCAIDSGIALFFPAPNSFTGEDVLELQGHGGTAVLRLVLRRCIELGARLAEPGEFSRRAFLNEKLDLVQAESVADLIDAGSEAAARAAMRSLKGEFSAEIIVLVSDLVELRALVEACIDFPEEDTHNLDERGIRGRLREVRQRVAQIQQLASSGSLLREGVQVVLVGQPNVGKSSLLNRLAGEELAIVTAFPGTTRDAVRGDLVLDGLPVRIVDTAGLRETQDPVERIGVERTWAAVREADIVLLLLDVQRGRAEDDDRIVAQGPASARRVIVVNKIDLTDLEPSRSSKEGVTEVRVSAKTGAGMNLLREVILEAAGWIPQDGVFLARARHLDALAEAAGHMGLASERYGQLEFFAEELRLAQAALTRITGEFTADDLLGEIFSRFCIGK